MESFMRRVFGTAVIAAAAIVTALTPAQAQLTMGVQAGVNSSNISLSESTGVNTSSYTAFMAGGWVGAHLGSVIALQVEAFYTQKGSKLSASGVPNETLKIDYVEVPLILRVGIPIIPVIKPYIFGGPSIAFNVSCKTQTDGGGASVNCDDPTGLDTEIKSTDFSGIIGLGIQLSRFIIAIQYDHGFDNIIVEDGGTQEVNNRTWTLKGGFGI
jgi:hypothetical protein